MSVILYKQINHEETVQEENPYQKSVQKLYKMYWFKKKLDVLCCVQSASTIAI